ncbi:unnamed protein product, partial [Symbiodinium sp. KB8]
MGSGSKRIEHNWLLPKRPTASEDFRSIRKAVLSLQFLRDRADLRHAARSAATLALQNSGAWKRERRVWKEQKESYTGAATPFRKPRNHVICPDDKVRQYKWWLPTRAYFLMMAWFVQVSNSWSTTSISPEDANGWCTQLLLTFVPQSLHRRMGIRHGGWFLAYMYTSMKAKCFGSGATAGYRTCQKPGHSCVRRIVSYAGWRANSSWRAAGRALKFIVHQVTNTEEIQSLKDARIAMESRINRLVAACVPGQCDTCGRRVDCLQGVVADAGHFYESVQSTQACEAADAILRRAEEDGHSAVTVAGRRRAFFGGVVFRSLRQCLVFTLEELYWLFAAASSLKYAHTGSRVWSFSGLPIGGLLSQATTSFVLGWQEHIWSFDDNKRMAYNFEWSDRMWNHMVARGRYVDDVLWLSYAPFEITGPTGDTISWLETKIQLRCRTAERSLILRMFQSFC